MTVSSSPSVLGSFHKNQRLGLAKNTWDDKKDFPSSFVHDNCSNSRKDNLDQTHEHWSKVTVLKENKAPNNKIAMSTEKKTS